MSNGVASIALEVKFAPDKPAGSFSGYGAVYGNIDEGGDMIAPGAMARSLASWSAKGGLPSSERGPRWEKGAGARGRPGGKLPSPRRALQLRRLLSV